MMDAVEPPDDGGRRAWLLLAVGDDRQHGGNDGYDDDPAVHYSWDSTVPNHGALRRGDFIALWDKRTLLGASVIDHIDVGSDLKDRYSCPACGRSTIKQRTTLSPRFKCYTCKAEFEDPVTRRSEVVTYRSRHDIGWVDLSGALAAPQLRTLCVDRKSQLSLRPLRWPAFRAALQEVERADGLAILEREAWRISGGHRTVTVRARLGQGTFRQRLLERYGERCAFTGAAPAAVLEAAHLYSYAEVAEHQDHGGMLVRRDLHRLFDLGFIAVDPTTDRVQVSPALARFPTYARLDGQPLGVELASPARKWLRKHWELHRPAGEPIMPGTGGRPPSDIYAES